MATDGDSMYVKAVRLTRRYLGPTADNFMARQVENHLHKSPDELSASDLLDLIDWISVTACLFVEDNQLIETYTNALRKMALSASTSKPRHR